MEENKINSCHRQITALESIFYEMQYDFERILSLFPALSMLETVMQEPEYHAEGNVLQHTRLLCSELIAFEEWKELTGEKKTVLFLAAIFHDIGKYCCTKVMDGRIQSPKHAVTGERIFRELVYIEYQQKYSISFELREHAANLIRFHGLPLFFMEKKTIEHELIKAASVLDMELLYLLAKADFMGRKCKDKERFLFHIEYFKEYTKELGCYGRKYEFANEYTRFKYLSEDRIWPGDALFDKTEFDVIIMSGFPLAGKDTYIETKFPDSCVISLDSIREELHISPSDGSAKVAVLARERAREYLRQKKTFIWNATNIVKDTREKLVRLFTSYGARVTIIYVEAPYRELFSRNKTRQRTVPEDVINRMIQKFDMPKPWEGYRLCYIVSEGEQKKSRDFI